MDGMELDILGTKYCVKIRNAETDPALKECSGYCDHTVHELVIEDKGESDLGNFSAYQHRILRHEIIHAFLFESGLGADATYQQEGEQHPELMIDWFARQAPKIFKTYTIAGIID